MKKVYWIIFVVIIFGAIFFMYEEASYFAKATRDKKILFVGDMFFDRQIRKVMYQKDENFIFSCIGDFLKDSDLVVGNLEGPITEKASVSLLSEVDTSPNYVFTFPTITAKLLAKNNIKIVTLGNNHIGNFGREGIASTHKHLKEAGVEFFGGLSGDEPILRKEIGDHKLSFIAYNEFGGESKEKVAEKIKKEKADGQKVIVFAHWGEEYISTVQRVKNAAKLFAQNGADFIVGSHPHIIQASEMIGGIPVYYSLGNFIFDQYWNREVSTGLMLEVKIKNEKMEILEHRASINRDGTTCLQ